MVGLPNPQKKVQEINCKAFLGPTHETKFSLSNFWGNNYYEKSHNFDFLVFDPQREKITDH